MSQKEKIEPLILMRTYMMERFLERISKSEYKNHLILKGGMLITAMVGINTRTTMDIDTTIKGILIDSDAIKQIINRIIAIDINDGVSYRVKAIGAIMEESDYPGMRVSLEALFDGVKTPLKIDFSCGDIIIPLEIAYEFPLLFEERRITVMAYPLETVLAEKIATAVIRSVTNTRMRDYYDIYILLKLYGNQIRQEEFSRAYHVVIQKRGSALSSHKAATVLNEIEKNQSQIQLWRAYQQKFLYAAEVNWSDVMAAQRSLEGVCKM